MAVARVGTPYASIDFQAGTGLGYSYESGSNRLMLLLGGAEAGGSRSISSVTYDGTAADTSALNSYFSGTAIHAYMAAWKEATITGTGAVPNDFALTMSSTTTNSYAAALTLTGVDQTTPIGATALDDHTTSTTSWPLTGLAVSAGDMAVIVACGHTTSKTFSASGYTSSGTFAFSTGFSGRVLVKAISASGTETPTVTLDTANTGATYFFIVKAAATSTKKLKLLAKSSAQSASSVSGIVFTYPTGGNIVGTEIGEFTGKSFEGTLESGQAVLKVPVADFGGTSLTTSDTPVVLVRTSTNTTGVVTAQVIEE